MNNLLIVLIALLPDRLINQGIDQMFDYKLHRLLICSITEHASNKFLDPFIEKTID